MAILDIWQAPKYAYELMPTGILIFFSVVVLFHVPLLAVLLIWKDGFCYAKATAAFLMFTEIWGMSKVASINVIMIILLLLFIIIFWIT